MNRLISIQNWLRKGTMMCACYALILLFAAVAMSKDYYMEIATSSKTGDKESSVTSKVWLSPKKIKVEHADIIIIVRNDLNTIYYAEMTDKKYMVFSNEKLSLLELAISVILNNTHYNIKDVKLLDKQEKIKDWKCTKAQVSLSNNETQDVNSIMTIWSTKKINLEYSVLDEIIPLVHQPFSLLKELRKKIEGFPVSVEGEINLSNKPIYIKGDLTKFEKKSLNNDVFEIPKDYSEIKLQVPKEKN